MSLKNAAALPRLEPGEMEEQAFAELLLNPEDIIEGLRLSGVAMGDAARTRWSNCVVERARLAGVPWGGAHWQDMILEECDLANATAREFYGARVLLRGCRLLGLNAPESTWYDLNVRDCQARMAQFRYGKFKRAHFKDCDLGGADFGNCDLRGARFENCDLREARFPFCKLDGADMRSCDVTDMVTDAPSLQGLIVSPLQAASFGKLLGLRVAWTEADYPVASSA